MTNPFAAQQPAATDNPFGQQAPAAQQAAPPVQQQQQQFQAPATQQAAPPVQYDPAQQVPQPQFQAPPAQQFQAPPAQQAAPVPNAADAFAQPGAAPAAGDPFGAPSPAGEHNLTDYVNELVLVTPTEWIDSMPTRLGESSAMRADFVVLTGAAQGLEAADALVFQTILKKDLQRIMRSGTPMLLGRLVMGNAKPGKSAPYLFEPASNEDMTLARQYLASKG